ncbi:tetraacyldisaccharide 4'-kinase [Allopusillimonas ginsengisoli]|uniref:tetraacyldisaccharide 4'-kinase n=1 Tax=Allopusillimonas ginsengisoli TaxID=453575 RepID=UPI00101F7C1D|nr:tetraacyldisaccharide 4'-kinase [Allopusillimonas ginsengisoli]TEA78069.1 tetraacyldisaccharide 4'-kinase [Allopusillimonas ginsengisoli]
MKLPVFLHTALQNSWQRKGLLSTLLLPFSLLTRCVIARKRAAYQKHPERVYRTTVPVVVVGNLYVGGTGKTPVVIALVQALRAHGWTPGVVSRGYGAQLGDHARTARRDADPRLFGDEPSLITLLTAAPVAVHPNRPRALRALQRAFPEVDVVISDDGLQHLALGRDIQIVVQDGRGLGNGRVLPAGPLREPPERLREVNVVITNLTPGEAAPAADMSPAQHVVMRLLPQSVEHLQTGRIVAWPAWLAEHGQETIAALAAIGRPERFFTMLRHAGLTLATAQSLPDHDAYTGASPFDRFDAKTLVLITAKDAVKCRRFNDDRLWVVHATAQFSPADWADQVSHALRNVASPAPRD